MERPKPKISHYAEMPMLELKSEKTKTLKELLMVGSASAYLIFD